MKNFASQAAREAYPLEIENHRISALKLNRDNPRVHSPRQIRQIARSIEAFGFNVPVLVDSDLNVVAGHGRILACRQLGWSEVPNARNDEVL